MELVKSISTDYQPEDLAQTTKYTQDELEIYKQMFAFDWNIEPQLTPQQSPQQSPQIDLNSDLKPVLPHVVCPHCHKPVDVR